MHRGCRVVTCIYWGSSRKPGAVAAWIKWCKCFVQSPSKSRPSLSIRFLRDEWNKSNTFLNLVPVFRKCAEASPSAWCVCRLQVKWWNSLFWLWPHVTPNTSQKEDYTLDEQHCDVASHHETCGELDNPDGRKTLNPAPGRWNNARPVLTRSLPATSLWVRTGQSGPRIKGTFQCTAWWSYDWMSYDLRMIPSYSHNNMTKQSKTRITSIMYIKSDDTDILFTYLLCDFFFFFFFFKLLFPQF